MRLRIHRLRQRWVDGFVCAFRYSSSEELPKAPPIDCTKITATAPLRTLQKKLVCTPLGWACGVCIGDYNNDGFDDIFCTTYGQNILYRNNGNGTFTDVTKEAGLWSDELRYGAGCSFLDYNRDGHLDLFVSNYVGFAFESAGVPGENPYCRWKGVPSNADLAG